MTQKYTPGSIFTLPDRLSYSQNSQMNQNQTQNHNYIVIGRSPYMLGLMQAMSITSMRNKAIEMEVPVLLCNNMISYIVPCNIFSFFDSEVMLQNYKGQITDTEIITKDDFIMLLRDIYLDGLGLGDIDHEKIKWRYDEYCSAFFEHHKNIKEYRDADSAGLVDNKVDNKKENNRTHVKKGKKSFETKADLRMKKEIAKEDQISQYNEYHDPDDTGNMIVIPDSIKQAIKEKENIDMIHTSPKKWTDQQLVQFIAIMDAHKGDPQFRLEFTGFEEQRAVNDKVYAVRREARSRKLLVAK